MEENGSGSHGPIRVFLADDNLIVREGVRALINARKDLDVVGVTADYDELVSGAEATRPQVLVTDIRMPPTFTREGIDAAREVRKRHPARRRDASRVGRTERVGASPRPPAPSRR